MSAITPVRRRGCNYFSFPHCRVSLTKLWGMLVENGFYSMVTTTTPSSEHRTLLPNISWQTFKTMLAEMGSERVTRLAYDQGFVEVMTPVMPHENSNRLIEVFVGVLCEELGLEIKRTGSLTLTRESRVALATAI